MATLAESIKVSCATEVFLVTALLHREQPNRPDFTIQEIVNCAAKAGITRELRSGVNVHASLHCVANRPPNPATHKMLFATGKHTRRLLLPGDEILPARTGKIFPDEGEVPEKFLPLLDWAKQRYEDAGSGSAASGSSGNPSSGSRTAHAETPEQWLASLFELEGLGKEYWKDEDPDEFVRKLREGWE